MPDTVPNTLPFVALLVAGGSGTRMNSAVPKQFMHLGRKPLLLHTMDAFIKAYPTIRFVIVLPQEHREKGEDIVRTSFPMLPVTFATGGATRFESVKNGLDQVSDGHLVFVHDAVRCLISTELIKRCAEAAIHYGSAVPAIAAKDSIRICDAQGNNHMIDRRLVRMVQTPQVFESKALKTVFASPYQSSFTDEATVWEAFGNTVHLVEGEERNIKITHPSDLNIAEEWLARI
ncbi:MAG: 2-C-methyl-D-erythritol 4-phosphate cytidylyltransferase [Ferruginibacter sp.]